LVRRTSEIILFDASDKEILNAKNDLYEQVDGKWKINQELIHRQMSNNSIFYKKKPTREKWAEHIKKMRFSGEPGSVNSEAASRRRPNFQGVNPCVEILLNNRGLCNLTTLNLMAFVKNGLIMIEELLEAQRLSGRASYRMTNVELELPKWDMIQKDERLTGCSLTGWQDMVNATNLSIEDQITLLEQLREAAIAGADEVAEQLGTNKSLLVTTIKPEGTISQLPTVSSGLHYSHSPYYIRRVRINSHDPLVEVCEELGFPIKPEVGQEWETCRTKVIEFPVKAPEGRTKYDVSALEQLENYKMFMKHYVQHNASITVHVRDHEWSLVEQWMWDNWDDTVAVSFLSLDDSFYELLPYEAIDEEEYNRRFEEVGNKHITPLKIAKYEKVFKEFELDESCDAGVCPIR
jgi:adenosylcobalamin-dependent ribonucleoside-triphosphate reductase